MSNHKSGAWAGDREAATRREYNRLWRKRHPDYMRNYHRRMRKLYK